MQNSKKVAFIIEHAAASVLTSGYENISSVMGDAKDKCLTLALNDQEKTEVNRRILEWQVRLFCENNFQFDLVNQQYQELSLAGYSNLEVESNIVTVFARYCIENGRYLEAQKPLMILIKKLEIDLEETRSEFYEEMLKFSAELLDEVNEHL